MTLCLWSRPNLAQRHEDTKNIAELLRGLVPSCENFRSGHKLGLPVSFGDYPKVEWKRIVRERRVGRPIAR